MHTESQPPLPLQNTAFFFFKIRFHPYNFCEPNIVEVKTNSLKFT